MGWFDDLCDHCSDVVDNPELLVEDIANVGGKIIRGGAAVVGGAVEAGGAVLGATVDIASSAVGEVVGLVDDDVGDAVKNAGETVAAFVQVPGKMVSDTVQSVAATGTLIASRLADDYSGEREAQGVIDECGGSLAKNVFGTPGTVKRGAIVKIDLGFGLASHTAIAVSKHSVIEVAEIDDRAVLRRVSLETFSSGGPRTGAYVYVASSCGEPLISEDAAKRAENRLRSCGGDIGEYELLDNNCHLFTVTCLLGKRPRRKVWTEDEVTKYISQKFQCGVDWLSAGQFLA